MKIKLSRHRFKKNSISNVIKTSPYLKAELFTIYFTNDSNQQYAFICPRKLTSAPNRSKIKRQLKEAFLKIHPKIDSKVSLIIIANKKIMYTSFKKIHDMLLLSLKKKNLINENR